MSANELNQTSRAHIPRQVRVLIAAQAEPALRRCMASASALVDLGGPLAVDALGKQDEDLAELAARVARQSLRLRPHLHQAVGPAVYVRLEALELIGRFDEELPLRWALEVDFAQRCL